MKNMMTCLTVFGLFLGAMSSQAQADDKKEKKYEFKIETLKEQPTITIRFKVPPDSAAITAKYGETFGAVFSHVISNGGQPAGAPFGRYHAINEDELDIEAGVVVAKAMEGKGEIKASTLPGGKVATTIHFGPYTELHNAHAALEKWVGKKGHKSGGPAWEVYLTDPSMEQDQSKWQTKVFMPIAEKGKDKKKDKGKDKDKAK